MTWLRKIEALKQGDKCEFRYPARKNWLAGTVVRNGNAYYWHVRDDSGGEFHGQVCEALFIECVRLPGQIEAWP